MQQYRAYAQMISTLRQRKARKITSIIQDLRRQTSKPYILGRENMVRTTILMIGQATGTKRTNGLKQIRVPVSRLLARFWNGTLMNFHLGEPASALASMGSTEWSEWAEHWTILSNTSNNRKGNISSGDISNSTHARDVESILTAARISKPIFEAQALAFSKNFELPKAS